jgi:hypothetical protein
MLALPVRAAARNFAEAKKAFTATDKISGQIPYAARG